MEPLIPFVIYLVVPLSALGLYLWLVRRMLASEIPAPPIFPLFLLFASYGGWLLIGLTLRFWYWSGMALLGLLILALIAPIVLLGLAAYLFPRRNLSPFHLVAFIASAGYVMVIGILLIYRWYYRTIS